MEGWKTEKLKDLVDELVMGQSPDSSSYNLVGDGEPFIQGNADMKDGFPFIRMYTTDSKRYSEIEDILLSVRAPVGDIFYNNYGGLSIGRGLSAIRIKNSGLRNYVFHYLKYDKQQFAKLEQGTTFTEIGKKEVRNLKIFLPNDKAEQTAIAKILSTVDETIRSTRETISKLERVKKSLMQNLLSGKMKPDGTLRPADEFYEDDKMGLVPKGWKVVKLGSLFKIKAGGDLQEMFFSNCKDETHIYPVFSNSLDNKGLYGYTSNPRFFADESVTLTGRGNVGHSVYRQGDYDAIIRLISLIPLNPDAIDCRYITYFIDQFTHFSIESTGVPQLTCPRVFKTKIILPQNKNEQLEISQKISNIEIQIENKQAKITALELLKKSLMQQLLTGRVRVK